VSAARAALAVWRPDAAAGGARSTLTLRAERRTGRRRPAPTRPAGRPKLMRGAARSLLVTPWFAAGTGFVIAAGLWVYSPHTVLRFPSSAVGDVPCQSAGCSPGPAGSGGGSATGHGSGEHFKGTKAGVSRASGSDRVSKDTALAGLKFDFVVLWRQQNGFAALITVSGHAVPKSWKLSFVMSGVRIGFVTGADWRSSAAGDGGTASPLSHRRGGGYGGGGGGGYGANAVSYGSGHDHGFPEISFTVSGTGPVRTPTNCTFDGDACTFSG
jgi:hypothetical protein